MLKVVDVGMNYLIDNEADYVIRNISFELEHGECLAVVGGSGCGKTTLLSILGGLLSPSEGFASLDGKNVRECKDVAVILQDYGLFPWKTVKKNMMLPLTLKKRKDAKELCQKMLEKLQLEKVKDSYPGQLSGGQKQRVAIGRAILSEPKMILMDEPFSALDSNLRTRLNKELKDYFRKNDIITVIVTHSIREAAQWGNKIMIISNDGGFKLIENDNKKSEISCINRIKAEIGDYIMGEVMDA